MLFWLADESGSIRFLYFRKFPTKALNQRETGIRSANERARLVLWEAVLWPSPVSLAIGWNVFVFYVFFLSMFNHFLKNK